MLLPKFTSAGFYYLCFLVMYILCIVFIYQKFSEIIAFLLLFIVHTTFFIFIGKDILDYAMADSFFIPRFIAITIGVSSLLLFVSLVLLLQLIMTLRKKYTIDKGTPIYLPKKYQRKLDTFKVNIIVMFIIIFILLCVLFLGFSYININFRQLFSNLTVGLFFGNITSFGCFVLSLGVLGISGYQVYLANDLSLLKNNQLI